MRESEHTDELRRLALQLALQLPGSVADARQVIAMTSHCLDEFLVVRAPESPRARALQLGWKVDAATPSTIADFPAARPPRCGRAIGVCCLVVLLLAGCVGQAVFALFGAGAVATNLLCVVLVAMVYGRCPALVTGAIAALVTNLLVVPPTWSFSVPINVELVGVVCYPLAAVLVPWIQERREQLRSVSLRLASVPLDALKIDRAA